MEQLHKNKVRGHAGRNMPDPYDLGFSSNFKTVFGSNPISWLLPIPISLYEGNYTQMVSEWGLERPQDGEHGPVDHILGISFNFINPEFVRRVDLD